MHKICCKTTYFVKIIFAYRKNIFANSEQLIFSCIFVVPNLMKMKLISFFLLVCPFVVLAQVGINTTTPSNTLDINGTLRIRQTPPNENSSKDSLLVVNTQGVVARVSAQQVVNNYLKTFVKGSFLTTSDKTLTFSSGTQRVPFDYTEFDLNAEFNTATNTFTAKQNGIYAINVQIRANNSISVATNFGVAILKNNAVIARSSFSNIGITVVIVQVNVTPPLRATQTLVQLNTGDTIKFHLYSDLINVGLLGAREDSFFTIHQVR